ncbi:uncharacterized protein G2W53_008366 [Senna tora]|uniref:Uncharacterized protein n=1 Tax=Senna tora TaxID=362788 RepID=A0A834X9B5_9FABA|nr:uncharacterized protein G2W53_008366 [Senna tora]
MLAMGYNLYSNSISCDQRSWVEFLVVNAIASVRFLQILHMSSSLGQLLQLQVHVFFRFQVPVTGLGAAFIDKAGRKPLLLVHGYISHCPYKDL